MGESVRKFAMIAVNNEKIEFENMGEFTGEAGWKHPDITVATVELLFVTTGEVLLQEDEERYTLLPNDLLFLDANRRHFGFGESKQTTSFYWLHFFSFPYRALGLPKRMTLKGGHEFAALLSQLNHFASVGERKEWLELQLMSALIQPLLLGGNESRLAHEVAEYVRIHSDAPLRLSAVAQHFGYNANYLSKAFFKSFGLTLKQYVDRQRIARIRHELLSTTQTIQEIAQRLQFEDANSLVKFYVYHTSQAPSEYRRQFYETHKNRH